MSDAASTSSPTPGSNRASALAAEKGPLADAQERHRVRLAYERCYRCFGVFAVIMLLPLGAFAAVVSVQSDVLPVVALALALALYAVAVVVGEVFMRRALKSALCITE